MKKGGPLTSLPQSTNMNLGKTCAAEKNAYLLLRWLELEPAYSRETSEQYQNESAQLDHQGTSEAQSLLPPRYIIQWGVKGNVGTFIHHQLSHVEQLG